MRFLRCSACDAIAVVRRQSKEGHPEYACQTHAVEAGWTRICSVDGCDRPPKFKIEYRVMEKRALMTTCPEHFRILPDDMTEVFRME